MPELTLQDKDEIEQTVHRIFDQYGRALIGLDHYDGGKIILGCNCCYCAPQLEDVRE